MAAGCVEVGGEGVVGRLQGLVQGGGKAAAAFQRGIAALAQYIAREGHHRVPRNHTEELTVEGEEAPAVVKLGVWVSNTKSRRDKLTQEQRATLAELGVEWA
ncbi:helicase associated domain-containing protein [Streptomyces sp. NPDC039022]|uniref:helicase associated domain-containing protein n=1 Tax=Streptomyces sp. NPDC039022 TaxID=3157091 RepID=UPI0033DA6C4C